jgi:hypothetical protein
MKLFILLAIFLFSGSCSSEPTIFKPVTKTIKLIKPIKVDKKTHDLISSKAQIFKVMVIDSGIDPHKDLVNHVKYIKDSVDYTDELGHGTHVAGTIALGENLKDPLCHNVEIYSCKGFTSSEDTTRCINKAIEDKFTHINISLSGEGAVLSEFLALQKFLKRKGTKVTVAVGNGDDITGFDLTKRPQYPASYIDGLKIRGKMQYLPNGFFVVQNLCPDGVCQSSNTHPKAVSMNGFNLYSTNRGGGYDYRNGTSQASPNYLHLILKQQCENLKIKLIKE